jgi:Cytochrome P460
VDEARVTLKFSEKKIVNGLRYQELRQWYQFQFRKEFPMSLPRTGIAFLLVAVVAVAGGVASMAPASGQTDGEASPILVTKIPTGYRDWRLVSVAHEAGNLNDIRSILGNDTAIEAYREGKIPFPEGTVVLRLAWSYVPSEADNKAFGREQSFVAGPPTASHLQFMIKDSKKYAATGVGGTPNLTRTVNLPTRQRSRPAFPAIKRSKITTSSSLITRLENRERRKSDNATTVKCVGSA